MRRGDDGVFEATRYGGGSNRKHSAGGWIEWNGTLFHAVFVEFRCCEGVGFDVELCREW